ncbi:hypothetical protein KIPB_003447 [Kipferlia bialata]|uniref:Uncharacterized protein n=1 Tax=Kipferlia bialata TaxID=797122 RepID=A0A9K3GHG2_9EUKA|nr:hypothetical protein KIPB_003447 [Kipferlia bialata]|eukprot:g3447.t1
MPQKKKNAAKSKRRAAFLASIKTPGKIGGKPSVPKATQLPTNPLPFGNQGPFKLGRHGVLTPVGGPMPDKAPHHNMTEAEAVSQISQEKSYNGDSVQVVVGNAKALKVCILPHKTSSRSISPLSPIYRTPLTILL